MELWQKFNTWIEGQSFAVGSATSTDSTILLDKGSKNRYIIKAKMNIPGVNADSFFTFYDGAAATTPITGSVPYSASPGNYFEVDGAIVTTGSLGIRITGNDQAGLTAYVVVNYCYNY